MKNEKQISYDQTYKNGILSYLAKNVNQNGWNAEMEMAIEVTLMVNLNMMNQQCLWEVK